MNLVENINLNHRPFLFWHRNITSDKHRDFFHAHQGMEFLWIERGEGHVIIDQKVYEIKPDSLFYFQPFQLHRVKVEVSLETPYIRSLIVVEPNVMEPFLKPFSNLLDFFHQLRKEKLQIQNLDVSSDRIFLNYLFESLHLKKDRFNSDSFVENDAVFMLSFLQYLQGKWDTLKKESNISEERTSHHTENIMEWLEQHYHEPFQLNQLANDLHLSPSHISHLFKQATGSTISDYLNARRIREACLLLKTTNMPVKDIGPRVGLHNESYFVHWFKKHIGETPYQYRKHLKKVFDLNK
ncbi:AraC family transcriptional regulator [Chengkuizengella axinellae]|uniref:AraC family transcriptional regulator n=1 Tax=Chengkuizengella axinellae TaxID=3064388 RepID=A0ABT9IZI9_9BACL|nr:AraC family transcriptional regulator [Chengkuizengella sp. 2205SS18-9]MDP5274796.1 AraC family transcriptional regulator [Chengkuizengella sp. 2205SS18-9]